MSDEYFGLYRGLVVDNNDPLGQGSVRCQIPKVIGEAVSGWIPSLGGVVNPPAIGTIVSIQFVDGDLSYPTYQVVGALAAQTITGLTVQSAFTGARWWLAGAQSGNKALTLNFDAGLTSDTESATGQVGMAWDTDASNGLHADSTTHLVYSYLNSPLYSASTPKSAIVEAIRYVNGYSSPTSWAPANGSRLLLTADETSLNGATNTRNSPEDFTGAWVPYTANLTSATGANPTGWAANAQYMRIGKTCFFQVNVNRPTGAGADFYRVNLPFTVGGSNVTAVGTGFMYANDGSQGAITAWSIGVGSSQFEMYGVFGNGSSSSSGHVGPSWASTGFDFHINGCYQTA